MQISLLVKRFPESCLVLSFMVLTMFLQTSVYIFTTFILGGLEFQQLLIFFLRHVLTENLFRMTRDVAMGTKFF